MTAEAVAAYERAVALDPDYWIAHQNLGALYKQMGRVGDAVEHFKKATRLSMRQPSSSEAGSTGTRRRLGCLPGLIAAGAAMAILTGILRALPLL
jgi:tetratricopeptide (TPR) repeat protein